MPLSGACEDVLHQRLRRIVRLPDMRTVPADKESFVLTREEWGARTEGGELHEHVGALRIGSRRGAAACCLHAR